MTSQTQSKAGDHPNLDGLLTYKKVEQAQPFMTPSKLISFIDSAIEGDVPHLSETEYKTQYYGSPVPTMLKMPLLPPTDVKIREITSFGFKNQTKH